MKISNSKKQLAKIINENGGWRKGANWSVQHKTDGRVVFTKMGDKPTFIGCWGGFGTFYGGFDYGKALPRWHQTILSRDEYFCLYREQGLENALDEAPLPAVEIPSIEHLALIYRNAKGYAERKQQEADAAKSDAEAKLAAYVAAAGSAVGLMLSVDGCEPELVITDWRDLRVGDVIWIGVSPCESDAPEGEYTIVGEEIERYRNGSLFLQPVSVMHSKKVVHPDLKVRGWRFIRRPTRETNNA